MMEKPTKETTAIWLGLNAAHKHLLQKFETSLRKAGLPPTSWYHVLWRLESNRQSMRQLELEHQSYFDQSNLSRTLKRLVEDGLVSQKPAPEDRRGRVLTITPKGADLRLRMWDVYGAMMLSEIENKVPKELVSSLVKGLSALAPEYEKELLDRLEVPEPE